MRTISKWTVATAALLLALGGTASAQQWQAAPPSGGADHGASGHEQSGGESHGGMDHGGMDHGGMDHGKGGGMGGGMDHGKGGGMGGGGMGHGGGGMGGMGHGGMSHGGMGGGGMDHGGMDHGESAKTGESEEHDKHGGMMMKRLCGPAEHVEGRLAYLKAELQLTDAQAPQWNAFADAYRTAGEKTAQFCAAAKDHKMTGGVLEQLGMMERNMSAHLDQVRAVRAAAEPLFAALTDEQKKAAEETMTGVMEIGMGGMGGKGGMGGMGGMKH